MKNVIRYLRFSNPGQSNGSIEAQDLSTSQWIKLNKVNLVDTFVDIGKSAKTFDRPDFKKLREFISKHYKSVDYLLVDQMDRFSRDAGEAMSMVKLFQEKYSIQIISVTEGIVFDYETPGSFFRTGLQLLLAEEDNINRSIKIRKGIYAAKVYEGRYVHKQPPFGYKKAGVGKDRHLVIIKTEAEIVEFIYDSYLRNVPMYMIKKAVYEMGFNRKGNVAVERVLKNPIYAGLLSVVTYKDLPGGLFSGIHEAIIEREVWNAVQGKIRAKKPIKARTILDEKLPLRGVLKCHCGTPLTGAPSRGKAGKYFYYYKCRYPKHNNISAIKVHEQLKVLLEQVRLPESIKDGIVKECRLSLNKRIRKNRLSLIDHQSKLKEAEQKLSAVEEKWILGEISKDVYEKWRLEYGSQISEMKAKMEKEYILLETSGGILDRNLDMLTDINKIYEKATLLQKRELIRLLFDDNLCYRNGEYYSKK